MKPGTLRLFAVLLLAAAPVSAAEFGGVFYLNADFGGDTVYPTNLGDVTAGGIMHLAAGLAINEYAEDRWETQLTAGMKSDSVSARNGTVSFYRWPIEVLQFYKRKRLRVGAGLTYHVAGQVKCAIEGSCDTVWRFKDALGYVLQADLVVPKTNPNAKVREFTLGARYTVVNYFRKGDDAVFNGDAVGFSIGLGF